VHIHSVVGAGTEYPEDALSIARRAKELGLLSTVGIVHDETGRLRPLNDVQQKVIADIDRVSKPLFSFIRYNPWRANLAQGLPNDWHCPAGGRHLYICENGLVHYCTAQRGYPAIPLSQYTFADVERESKAKKSCAPYCTIACIQRVALLDELREQPKQALSRLFPAPEISGQTPKLPLPIKLLNAMLAPSRPSPNSRLFTRVALRVLNIR
jgi:hypothetical protein